MTYGEITPDEAVLSRLIALSADWEAEQSCYGYRKNTREDLQGRRIFAAEDEGHLVGYLFGRQAVSESQRSILPDGASYFEVEELYVVPALRSRGIGQALFRCAESVLRAEGVSCLMLSTATKNTRAILHFYLDEIGMTLWSARLFKKL